jgi:hypothetical protein
MREITAALTRLFARHRIIVWTDEKRELRPEFDALELPGVAKIAVGNDARSLCLIGKVEYNVSVCVSRLIQ